jgi:glycosyltransferase involved in cell wall biosynthesis
MIAVLIIRLEKFKIGWKIIQKYIFLANEKNLGNTKTFNQLAKKAKGEFIIDLAADDILLPNCIEKQVNAFQNSNYKNLGIVYGNLIEIDENGNFIRNYYTEEDHPESGDIYKMVVGRTTKICSVSSMIKKSVLEKLGYYDENLAYEDLDLWIRTSRDYEFEYHSRNFSEEKSAFAFSKFPFFD